MAGATPERPDRPAAPKNIPDPSPNELIRRRHAKLEALRAAGVDPFGARFPVSHWAGPLHARWDTPPTTS